VRQQHPHGRVGGRLQRHPQLALAAPGEALLRLPAGRRAAVDLPHGDLRRDQPRSVEHPARAAAEAHQQHPDPAVAQDVLDQPAGERRERHLHLGDRPVLRRQADLRVVERARDGAVARREAVEPPLQPLGRGWSPSARRLRPGCSRRVPCPHAQRRPQVGRTWVGERQPVHGGPRYGAVERSCADRRLDSSPAAPTR
jgi:hypothetical protein